MVKIKYDLERLTDLELENLIRIWYSPRDNRINPACVLVLYRKGMVRKFFGVLRLTKGARKMLEGIHV